MWNTIGEIWNRDQLLSPVGYHQIDVRPYNIRILAIRIKFGIMLGHNGQKNPTQCSDYDYKGRSQKLH